jgi:trypsin
MILRLHCTWPLIAAGALVTAAPALAMINGSPSGLAGHTVRILSTSGTAVCTGVAIGPRHVVTARHCYGGSRSVAAAGKRIRIAGAGAAGGGISVRGDAIVLTLAEPLPPDITPLAVGPGEGPFIAAGYGTSVEAQRNLGASLQEATLVPAQGNTLVDPSRNGSISASACYGDSGGPVVRRGATGFVLVGVITRASHPSPRLVCGHLTHYAPLYGSGQVVAATEEAARPRRTRRYRQVRR